MIYEYVLNSLGDGLAMAILFSRSGISTSAGLAIHAIRYGFDQHQASCCLSALGYAVKAPVLLHIFRRNMEKQLGHPHLQKFQSANWDFPCFRRLVDSFCGVFSGFFCVQTLRGWCKNWLPTRISWMTSIISPLYSIIMCTCITHTHMSHI